MYLLIASLILNVSNVNCILAFQVIDKSFGFDTAVEEAQRAINAAHVEAESGEHGVGVVKLMGRDSGKFLAVFSCEVTDGCKQFIF